MRLIDLDQKVVVPINDERYGTTYEVQMTVAEIFDKFLEGNKPEVIDAIPVDWIKDTAEELQTARFNPFWHVLFIWRKEQWQKQKEAQR